MEDEAKGMYSDSMKGIGQALIGGGVIGLAVNPLVGIAGIGAGIVSLAIGLRSQSKNKTKSTKKK